MMKISTLYRRYTQAMTAAAFAEADDHETARLLLGKESRPRTRQGHDAAGPAETGNRVPQPDFS